jgi:GcrA cell cycle regulator
VPWSDEEIEALTRLYKDGLSAAQIAPKLGKTRNAIIGKIHRLFNPSERRPRPVAKGRKRDRIPKTERRGPSKPLPSQRTVNLPKEEPSAEKPPMLNLPLLDLEWKHCRWPTEGEGITQLFCGRDKQPGRSYCRWHGP